MAASTIRISGLDQTVKAFNRLEKSVAREIQKELKTAVEPVKDEAVARISRFQGASLRTIRPRTRGASAFVTQNARKVTGKRGDFGRRQQRLMEEALNDQQFRVVSNIEGVLDRITRSEFERSV